MNLTVEQEACIQGAILGDGLKIKAFAGSGKTSTLAEIARNLKPKRGLYLAYNKSIQLEAKDKFPDNVDCKTSHSLAYNFCKYLLTGRFIRPTKVDDLMKIGCRTVDLAREAIKLINKFVQTDNDLSYFEPIDLNDKIYLTTEEYEADAVKEYIKNIAYEFWQKTTTHGSTLPIGHDIYLKLYQLSNPDLSKIYDFILFDECQDANPVLLDIVSKQTCQNIYVGDEHQQIYGWRGAINAFSKINGAEFYLSKSFRFGTEIEDLANMVLSIKGEEKKLFGNDKINTQVVLVLDTKLPYTVLCRKNETVIDTVLNNLDKRIHVVGSMKDTLNLLISGYALLKEDFKNVTYSALKQFKSWDDMVNHHDNSEDKDRDITLLVNFVDKYKNDLAKTLSKLQNSCHVSEKEADIIISTIHKSKGREWDSVLVENDFNISEKTSDEEWNLLYVAITRAQKYLCMKGNLVTDIRNIYIK